MTMTLDNAPDVLTVDEAAALLRIGRNHAYELVRTRVLRSVKLGRRILVPKAALVALLECAVHPQAA